MKILSVFLFAICFGFSSIKAQCVIDSALLDGPGVYPPDYAMPCIERDVLYDQILQIKNIATIDTSFGIIPIKITVHWVHVLSISGLPTDINWSMNPVGDTLNGGEYGCVNFTGTSNDPIGSYDLHIIADIFVKIPLLGDSILRHQDLSEYGTAYTFRVINQEDPCDLSTPTGMYNINGSLNTSLVVSPNPNQGIFEVKLTREDKISGDLIIMDMTGRKVFAQTFDPAGYFNQTFDLRELSKGLYILQLLTPEGSACKKISIQ